MRLKDPAHRQRVTPLAWMLVCVMVLSTGACLEDIEPFEVPSISTSYGVGVKRIDPETVECPYEAGPAPAIGRNGLTLNNGYDSDVELYLVEPSCDETLVATLVPNSEQTITLSAVNARFVARVHGETESAWLCEFGGGTLFFQP